MSLPLGKKVADKEKNMALQLVFDFDDKNANFMFRKNNDFTSITNDPTWLARGKLSFVFQRIFFFNLSRIHFPGDDFVLTFQFLQNELAVYEGDEIRHIKFITDHKHPIEKIESLDVSSYANKINVKSIDEIGFRYKNCNCK